MLSLYVSAVQCNGYTGVLILTLGWRGSGVLLWDVAGGEGWFCFPSLSSHCLARCLSVFVLQKTTLRGCTECSLFPFLIPSGLISLCSLGAEAVAAPWVPLDFLLQKQKALCNHHTFLWECCLQITSDLVHRALLFGLMPFTKAQSSVLDKTKLI